MAPGLRRAGRVAAGGALMVVGLVMLVLPGPGLPLVAAGLLVLGPEFPWARRARRRLLRLAARLKGLAGRRGGGAARRRAVGPGAALHG